jgi:hypothetical protein
MLRHAFFCQRSIPCRFAQPVSAFAVAMIQSAFGAVLVSAASNSLLLNPRALPTDHAAVTLSPITVRTDEEEDSAI